MNEKIRVLIIDDEAVVRDIVSRDLSSENYSCETAGDGQSGLDLMRKKGFDIALIDLTMPGISGFEVLEAIRDQNLHVVPIVLSGHGEVPNVVEALKLGAFDFIEKPAAPEMIRAVLSRAASHACAVTQAEKMSGLAGRLETLLNSISYIIIAVGADDRVILWNTAASQAFGIPAEKTVGRSFSDCGIDWDWSTVLPFIGRFRTQRNAPVQMDNLPFSRSDGKEGVLGMTINLLPNNTETIPGFLLQGADITERKMLEAELAHAQKLESIGQLAAGIAHEINTPTQYVGDNTRFLNDAFGDLVGILKALNELTKAEQTPAAVTEFLAQVKEQMEEADIDYLIEEIPRAIHQSLEGIGRVTKIVRAMKEFSHPGTDEKVAIDLNRAIESTITVAGNEWKYVAEIVTEFDPSLPAVPCLPGDFNQVILNLIINASHAIAEAAKAADNGKGKITVSTRNDGEWAEIRISDTGTGIPEKHRSRIFDPFFTTKEVGKGTGQGLAISRLVIVEKHGGSLTFETEVGAGTTFIIRLPVAG